MPHCLLCDGRGGLTEDNFLLVSDYYTDTLRQLNLANDSAIRIPIGHQDVNSPVYDPIEKTVYWFYSNYIKRAYLNGTQETLVWRQEYYRWSSSIRAIAMDPVSRLVYYTGTMGVAELGSNFLASMTLDGRHHFLLVTARTNSIDNIALDPVTGTMYWSVEYGIDMAAMDGSQHHHLVNSNNYIYGLTIDAEDGSPVRSSISLFVSLSIQIDLMIERKCHIMKKKEYSKSLRLPDTENLVSHRAAMSMLYLASSIATSAVRLSGRQNDLKMETVRLGHLKCHPY
ncbi:hypothetical protein NP493_2991g00003 [Ridgeia piscesae]|uniref:Uncharacterized protein n=1 Tax=Ridgeia piscesae TaxID=27915 RepID=A0AAD9JBC4_RIDPI|nr:hypothetical protein NP493_2991g00003 [Ridgeia piscesae]